MKKIAAAAVLCALALSGCRTSYSWRSGVPADMRTVAAPTFRNESDITELGSLASQQVLREFQREGTMKIAAVGDSAYEVQGVIVGSGSKQAGYSTRKIPRDREFRLKVRAKVSVIDKTTGAVLVGDRIYQADTTYLTSTDRLTAERDASGRVAEELARQIVDDVVARNWGTDDVREDQKEEPLEDNDYD